MVAAGDTFRAGAIDQLRVWAERTGAEFVGAKAGADPAAVAFDAIDSAVARGVDVLIVDTAGRLHTSEGLMDELKKVARVIAKRLPGAPHETLLVLDGTIGQNAVQQAKMFAAAVPVSGLVVTKLDGTARGGVVVAVHEAIDVPVKFLGVGEAADGSRAVRRDGVRAGAAERRVTRTESERRASRGRRRLYLDTPGHLSQGRRTGARRGAAPARHHHGGRSAVPRPASLRGREHRHADQDRSSRGCTARSIGTVISKGVIPTRKGLRIFQAVLRDETGMIEVSWPGQPFLDRTIDKGDVLLVTGNVRFFHGRQLQPREFVNLGDDEHAARRRGGCCRSIRRPKGCRSRSFGRSSTRISTRCSPLVTEYLPADVLEGGGRAGHRRRAAHGAPAVVARRGDGRAGRASRSRSCSSCSCCSSAPRSSRASTAPAFASRTSGSSRRSCARRSRSSSPARRCARCARSSPTCAATAACSGCSRATSAAARRSSRCSPRCSRSRTAIRRRSWCRRSCSPSSTRAR